VSGTLAALTLAVASAAGGEPAAVVIRTVPNRMAFDRARVFVEVGRPVALVVENRDIMPHNLVVAAPGSLVEVGRAAERQAGDADAPARGFVPRSARVLHATRLIDPGGAARLVFEAPREPGDYPFACTVPGHWRNMNGVMVVVPRLADVPPEALRAPPPAAEGRPFVRRWVMDDLLGELGGLDRDRSFERGRAMFAVAGCLQCHKVRGEGGDLGPDLTALPARLTEGKTTRAEVLREVLEPSRVIDPAYRPVLIETRDGDLVTGLVVEQGPASLRVRAGPGPEIREVALGSVAARAESRVSLMPEGLLATLSKEEILDLLGYVITGGDPKHPSFAR
jgi:putative heme-binding domain-containing protein